MAKLKLVLTPNEAGIYIYKPRDILKGCVELNVKRDYKCSCYVDIIGQILTKSYYGSGKVKCTDVLFSEKISFFDYPLPIQLQSEKCLVKFDYELPSILPYSLNLDNKNKIEYFAKASLVYEKDNFIKKIEDRKDFEVINEYDLNSDVSNMIGQHSEGLIPMCPLFCEKGIIQITSSIPYTGYVEGQIIPVTIKYINQSNIKIIGVTIKLIQLIEIKCNNPQQLVTDYQKEILSKIFPDPDLDQTSFYFNKPSDEFKVFINVPHGIYLSNSHVCDLIKVKYFLEVITITNSCREDLYLKMPIEIGTRKIRQARDLPGPSSVNGIFDNFLASERQARENSLENEVTRLFDERELNGNLPVPPEFLPDETALLNSGMFSSQQSISTDKPPEYKDILPTYEEVMSSETKASLNLSNETNNKKENEDED